MPQIKELLDSVVFKPDKCSTPMGMLGAVGELQYRVFSYSTDTIHTLQMFKNHTHYTK
jgi:hypothetical protein